MYRNVYIILILIYTGGEFSYLNKYIFFLLIPVEFVNTYPKRKQDP